MDDEPDPTADERYPHRARDAELVAAAQAAGDAAAGDQAGDQAFGQLYDLWFDRVYATALRIVGQPDVAAEVAQDAFLSAWRNLGSLEDPLAFGGWLLRIARNGALNRHDREQRSRPVDDAGITMIEATGASPSSAPAGFGADAARPGAAAGAYDPASVAELNEMQELVWSAVGALPERDAEVLDLQLRYGMSPAEIGEIIGVNRNAANQLVHRVRGRFETAVRARVLWRGDRPDCPGLAALLAASGVDGFGAEAVKLAERHATTCADCEEKRELRLRPAALFASVPLVAAPIVLKQQVAGAMEAAGVPMQGSAFSGSSTATASGRGRDSSSSTASGSSGSSGSEADSSPPDPDRSRVPRRGRRRQALAMAAVVVAVLLAAIVLFAVETHDPPVPEVAATTETSASGSISVSQASTTTAVPDASSSTTAAPVTTTTPTSSAPSSSTTEPTRVSVSIGLTPAGVTVGSTRSFAPPTLAWSVTGTGTFTVRVEGPAGDTSATVPSASASGSGLVCPGTLAQGQCFFPSAHPTSVDYVITVLAADGSVLATRTVTLAVT